MWFDESDIANVFSFAKTVKKHGVQFDSAVENTFVMHGPKGVLKFYGTLDNLCASIPKHKTGTDFNLVNAMKKKQVLLHQPRSVPGQTSKQATVSYSLPQTL